MRNVKVVVEFDGTDYFGFQFQPNHPTIQAEIERVLEKILKEKVTVHGSGRTDAGVHAAGQVISFRTEGTIPIDRLCVAMNSLLPRDIAALRASEMDSEFHARYSAKSRLYRYDILNADAKSALRGRFCWHVREPLDVDAMREAATPLIGVHDFTSFACVAKDEGSPIREMMSIDINSLSPAGGEGRGEGGSLVTIDMKANAYLRSMVRVIVGTLVEVGLGRRRSSDLRGILEAKDRGAAGKTAPPQGLCLVEVGY